MDQTKAKIAYVTSTFFAKNTLKIKIAYFIQLGYGEASGNPFLTELQREGVVGRVMNYNLKITIL